VRIAHGLSCALLTSTALCTQPALAQTAPPAFRSLDANGVDLVRGDHVLGFTEGVVGSGRGALALERVRVGNNGHTAWDAVSLRRTVSNGVTSFSLWGPVTSGDYSGSGPTYAPANGDGSVIVALGGNSYRHIAADGTETLFGDPTVQNGGASSFCNDQTPEGQSCELVPLTVTTPDGRSVTLEYTIHSQQLTDTFPPDVYNYHRLARVSNDFGYAIAFSYASDEAPADGAPSSFGNTRRFKLNSTRMLRDDCSNYTSDRVHSFRDCPRYSACSDWKLGCVCSVHTYVVQPNHVSHQVRKVR
jgi:hypothetical protein